jgi:hypothetical protein
MAVILHACNPGSIVYGEFERTAQPVALLGSGLAGVSSNDPGAILLNPASLAFVSSIQSSVFYSPSPFGLPQLSNGGVFAAVPSGSFNSALTLTSIGFSAYREMTATISLGSNMAEGFCIGGNLNINYLSIEGYGSETNIGIDVGAVMNIVENLRWGFSLLNINRPVIGLEKDPLPQWYLTGFTYDLSDFADVSVDAVKDVRYPISLRIGTHYEPVEFLVVRFGIWSDPSRYFAGIGIRYRGLLFDYAVATHTELGLSHSIGFSFEL